MASFEKALADAVVIDFKKQIFMAKADKIEKELNKADIDILSIKINLLPEKARLCLLGKYFFKLNPKVLSDVYEIDNAAGYTSYYLDLLSDILGLSSGAQIASKSMEKACAKAIENSYISKEENSSFTIVYLRHRKIRRIARIVAIAALLAALMAATAIGVNSEFKDYVVNWFADRHTEYTDFKAESEYTGTESTLQSIKVNYVPEGYELYKTVSIPCEKVFLYTTANSDHMLIISLTINGHRTGIDTEDAKMERVKTSKYYGWFFVKDTDSNFVYESNGFTVFIHGPINQQEIFKIADLIEYP